MTSVEELREAARLMRDRAVTATPGPWVLGRKGPSGFAIISDEFGAIIPRDAAFDEDAAHIASWHPAVALAVADLLVRMADGIERSWATTHESELPEPYVLSLAAARQYLGES